MIFRLVEGPDETTPEDKPKVKAVWPPTRKIWDNYNKIRLIDQKIEFLNTYILPHRVFKKVSALNPLIINSILIYGLDTKRNGFLNLVTTMNLTMKTDKYLPHMEYVYAAYKNNKLDMQSPVLRNPSLYKRNIDDFKYTLNAFWLMSDKKRAGNYIKDTSVIDITQFLSDGEDLATSTIKPAGINGRKGDTIFNVIEEWSQGNEYSPDEIRQRNFQRASSKKVDVKQLEDIKKKYSDPSKYPDRNAIEKELKANGELRDGVIVYHLRIDHKDFSTIDVDKGTFWIWKNDKWEEYDTPEARKVAEFK